MLVQNILFDSKEDNARIKITDFGLSKVFVSGSSTEGEAEEPKKEELAGMCVVVTHCICILLTCRRMVMYDS